MTYQKLQLHFDVLLMMGAVDTRNMWIKFAVINTCICFILLELINLKNTIIFVCSLMCDIHNAKYTFGPNIPFVKWVTDLFLASKAAGTCT